MQSTRLVHSEGPLKEPHDWSTGGSEQVVIRDTTIAGCETLPVLVIRRTCELHTLQTITLASDLACNLFQTRIQPRFELPSTPEKNQSVNRDSVLVRIKFRIAVALQRGTA